jgi:hypothetical protein
MAHSLRDPHFSIVYLLRGDDLLEVLPLDCADGDIVPGDTCKLLTVIE